MKHNPRRWNEWKDIEIPATYAAYSDDRLLDAYVRQRRDVTYRPHTKPQLMRYFRLRRELHRRLTDESFRDDLGLITPEIAARICAHPWWDEEDLRTKPYLSSYDKEGRTMSKEHLDAYTDSELALRFANDEGLYQARHLTWVETIETAQEVFIFTDAQLEELKEWWDDYQEEDDE